MFEKEKHEFLENEAVQIHNKIWTQFIELASGLRKEEGVGAEPKEVAKMVEQFSDSIPSGVGTPPAEVEKVVRKHFKSVNSILRLFYGVFPITKKQRTQKMKSL